MRALTAALLVICAAWGTAAPAAGPSYLGRPLVDVLEELSRGGLVLIYSSAVVKPRMKVLVEPAASEPRALLEEILPPLGLRLVDGPGGALLIVAGEPVFGDITGKVRSAARGVSVEGAVVRIPALGMSAVTGQDGGFRLGKVPAGTHEILTESVGFQPSILSDVRVASASGTSVIVWLLDQPGFVTEVVVTPGQRSVEEQDLEERRTVHREDAVLIPSFGGDVSRLVEYLPGVTAPDNSAAFHVRGSLPGDVSFILDGLELYDPYHLQSFQSPFSLIDSHIVERMDVSAGGYTVEFGDRHGGRVEVQTLLPDQPHEGEVQLGTLNSRFSYRAPLAGGAGAWLVAGRGWYPETFQDNIELGGGERVDPRFADLYIKGAFTLSPSTVLSIHGLGVEDHLKFEEEPDEDGPGESAFADTGNHYLWANILTSWGPGVSSLTQISYGTIDRERHGLSEPEDDRFEVDDRRDVDFLGLRHETTVQAGASGLVKAGFEGRELRASYRYKSMLEGDPGSLEKLDIAPDGRSAALFASYRARLGRRLIAEAGLRWDRQDYTDDNQLSPRLHAVWSVAEHTELRMGIGKYTQSQRIHELRVEDGERRYHQAEESIQTEISYLHQLDNGLRVRLDAYSRLLKRVNPRYENLWKPIELFPETGDDRVRIHPDESRMRGAELLLQGRAGRPFTWWASYAWSRAEDSIRGEDIPRSWDQTHTGKVLLGYRWSDRWMISLTGTARTGWPTTPVSATWTPDPNGGVIINETVEERNSDRFPTYIRVDAKGSASFPMAGTRLSLIAEIINLTDRDNPCCVDEFIFHPRPGGRVDVDRIFEHWRTLTPTFSVLWEF